MTPYERGFAAGERAAHEDKKRGNPLRIRPEHSRDGYEAAWWDGYTPRSLSWALRPAQISVWWGDYEPSDAFCRGQMNIGREERGSRPVRTLLLVVSDP